MKRKPIVLRAQAEQDIQQAVDYYLDEGAEQAGLRFIDALERAFTQIALHPAAGSPRYAHELDLPGLRHWPVKRFPYLVFMSNWTRMSMSGACCMPNATSQPGCRQAGNRSRRSPARSGLLIEGSHLLDLPQFKISFRQ